MLKRVIQYMHVDAAKYFTYILFNIEWTNSVYLIIPQVHPNSLIITIMYACVSFLPYS